MLLMCSHRCYICTGALWGLSTVLSILLLAYKRGRASTAKDDEECGHIAGS